jgi:hypothetical protein
VAELQAVFQFDEALFHQTVSALIKSGRLRGSMAGTGMRATYTPSVFSDSQVPGYDEYD